ncbi:TPA: hypothetical protein ACH3X1_014467 [Trebouxia sp. C0004]
MFNKAYSSGKVPIQWQTALIHLQTWGRFRPRQLQTNCSWGALVQAIHKYSQSSADSVHRAAAALHTHKLDTNLTSVLSTKHLFYNMSLISKHMHMNHCTSVL